MAFILGVMPLAIATGAGAGGRIAIGTGVIGGMLTATVLAVFLVPVFFVWVRSMFKGRRRENENLQPRAIGELTVDPKIQRFLGIALMVSLGACTLEPHLPSAGAAGAAVERWCAGTGRPGRRGCRLAGVLPRSAVA